MVNKVFYAKGKVNCAKAYNRGEEVAVGSTQKDRLMIIQGPLGVRPRGIGNFFLPAIECAEISNINPLTSERIDFWVNTRIRVKGRNNLIFIKLHTHGAWEGCSRTWFDGSLDKMLDYFEKRYNDRGRYCLHYVSAREMYNVIKALEAGVAHYTLDLRNFVIKPPLYNEV
jgi:hypothetical protein